MLILSFVAKATGRKIAEVFDFQWLHLATSEDFLNNFLVIKPNNSNLITLNSENSDAKKYLDSISGGLQEFIEFSDKPNVKYFESTLVSHTQTVIHNEQRLPKYIKPQK